MIRLSQIAAPVALGAALFFGAQGCSDDRRDVPEHAMILDQGRENVDATATESGIVYVYDATAKKLVYSGRVAKGDSVRIDAKEEQVLLNGRVASKRDDLIDDHKYQILFEPGRDLQDEATVVRHRDGTTVIEGNSDKTVIEGSGTTVIKDGDQTIVKPNNDPTVIHKKETVIHNP